MAQTIESFVQKLQQEGIQAGQQEAQRLRQEAQQQAKQITEQAQLQAQQIIQQAKLQGQQDLERAHTELQLACRDAMLRLRDALSKALGAILAQHAGQQLSDPQFLAGVLHELVGLYAKADLEHRDFELNVSPQLQQKLSEWALGELATVQTPQGQRHGIDLKGTLRQAGFEYRADGATIEVTQESVAQLLLELVGPRLREIIEKASPRQGKEA